MPRFRVLVTKEYSLSYQVDAEDAEEAEFIVNEAIHGDEEEMEKLEADPENGLHFELCFEEPEQIDEMEER